MMAARQADPGVLTSRLLVFDLDNCRYGLPLESVERVARIVEITPLPKAPEIVLGVVNFRGRIVPVVNLRARFRLPHRAGSLSDQLIVGRTPRRTVALVVDSVEGVVECSEHQIAGAETVVPATEYLAGVMKLSDGLVLIHDLALFLSLDEERHLDAAMSNG